MQGGSHERRPAAARSSEPDPGRRATQHEDTGRRHYRRGARHL